MLRWCAYCQRYLGEIAPFEDYFFTHGICPSCQEKWGEVSSAESIRRLQPLVNIQSQLLSAGQSGNLEEAREALTEAIRLKVQPIDFLMGILQPCLYAIGKDWECGEISVAEEHRFTSLAAAIVQICSSLYPNLSSLRQSSEPQLLLVTAHENTHTLGTQMVELFTILNGVKTFAVFSGCSIDKILQLIKLLKPSALGISIALPTQIAWVHELESTVSHLPDGFRPKILVGGYPLRNGGLSPLNPELIVCHSPAALLDLL